MKKTIIAVLELSPLANSILQAFIAEAPLTDRTIIVARPGIQESSASAAERESDEDQPLELPCLQVEWNPLSYASTRSAWQQAENLVEGCPDELVILIAPQPDTRPLEECGPRDLERCALANGSALALLIQEADRRFAESGGGSLVVALCNPPQTGPLPSMALGAATGLTEGILALQQEAGKHSNPDGKKPSTIRFMAVRDESGQPDLLSRYLTKILDENPKDIGKILRHTGRSGLFGRA